MASVRAIRALSKASKHLIPSESTKPPSEFVAQTPYHDVIISHIQTLLLADQDDDEGAQAEFDLGEDGGAASPEAPKELPTVRLRISLMHSSSLNSGVRIVSSEQENTSAPSWDNLGEVYFRGTLRDLDATYLEMELGSPNWVSLQAKVEGWGELLNDWHFGWLEGRVMIAHTPRYRQLGEVCEVDTNRVYLIVKVLSVDQIITADNRSSVDAYVEVSFDGTSRRTRIIRSSLNPVWDDEVTIPLRFASMRDISYSEIQKKGKVHLDVWGVGNNYVDHLGGCTFYLYEIYFNEKNQRRTHVSKERIILSDFSMLHTHECPVTLLTRDVVSLLTHGGVSACARSSFS
ncbi:hypothetical protein Emag_002646 [Eimeria magna]